MVCSLNTKSICDQRCLNVFASCYTEIHSTLKFAFRVADKSAVT
uniref:Uncharacterized protein n=1 Tax=Anguilla anguilla TaxID=7936 RepID=A0A0E9QJT9_ANGAN